jgi:uracil-DNA glycosylase
MKYTTFDYDLSSFNVDEDYGYVRLPYESAGKTKVLFLLDHVPSEDLHTGRLLSGQTGDLLNSLISATKKIYGKQSVSFSWLAATFNAFRTYGKSAEFRASAEEAFKIRAEALILKYQPDYVVAFGTSCMRALIGDKLVEDKGRKRYSHWLGVPVKKTVRSKKATHTTTVVSNISLNDLVTGDSGEASLLGYMCRCLLPIFGSTYLIDAKNILSRGIVFIDKIAKFHKLIDMLAEKKFVAIDTETKNLNKITNQLLTVQFAYDETKAFIVPIAHKDSPFTPSEIREIQDRLRDYLEGNNRNEYHIYTNAKFDLTVFRSECGVRYFANDVWDILAGEFATDENRKHLDLVLGEYFYSLGNLSVQYGFEGYLNAEFGKQHRAGFSDADLTDEAVLRYTGLDVCVPIAIHNQQIKHAQDTKYTGFRAVVTKEISDTIHAFSKMEHTGAGLDVNYLFYLRTEDSPIEQVINQMAGNLLGTEAAKKANAKLAKDINMPTTSLFGSQYQVQSVLKLNKPAHRKLLFFDVLKLKPLDHGKSGEGKLDKKFQQHYAHVPEVAQYTALEKAKKLKNAYVNSFIQMLGTSEDLQKDHRIRPNYGYLTVVTHRTSARDPY